MNRNFKLFKNGSLIIDSLCIFNNLRKEEVIKKYHNLLNYLSKDEVDINKCVELYNEYAYTLLKEESTLSLKKYIIDKIFMDDNPFTKCIDNNSLDSSIVDSVKFELSILQKLYNIRLSDIKKYLLSEFCEEDFNKFIIQNLIEEKDEEQCFYNTDEESCRIKRKLFISEDISENINEIIKFYSKNGTGIFGEFRAFVWEKKKDIGYLKGIKNPDTVTLKELTGYEEQKKTITQNTVQFLNGYYANNILLYGQRGTGKSSTVKAIINEYYKKGLRLIEVDKDNLSDFGKIVEKIKNKNLKFIIFVDDLVFNEGDERYSALKTILEGKVENNTNNILIYATTNRKHLVKESFSERGDEIHALDSVEEKLSLSDRFGITVSFYSPNQKEYLKIIDSILERSNIDVDIEYVHKEALKWVRYNNAMSPRCAKQFMYSFIGKYKNGDLF